ncbi:hypothetical protein PT277_02285 [Acetobacteraceae bacterium ESL0709]|nr:hypothetical protein [Acetobacteraceae bacterium ESL0697]MDF7677531.1 hypothetical protein [Acetobacteraceae bacterium ESL0709]
MFLFYRRTIAGVVMALTVMSPFSASAAPQEKDEVLETAKTNFQTSYREGGLKRVADQIVYCYQVVAHAINKQNEGTDITPQKLSQNKALRACYLEDMTLAEVDLDRREAVIKELGVDPGPIRDFYRKKFASPRVILYAAAFFPSNKDAERYINASHDAMLEGLGIEFAR